LELHNPSQQVEVTGPGWNLLAIQVLLRYDHLLFEKLFVSSTLLPPAVKPKVSKTLDKLLTFPGEA